MLPAQEDRSLGRFLTCPYGPAWISIATAVIVLFKGWGKAAPRGANLYGWAFIVMILALTLAWDMVHQRTRDSYPSVQEESVGDGDSDGE